MAASSRSTGRRLRHRHRSWSVCLQVDGPALADATYYDVTLGCVTVRVVSLPASINVSACNLGTDTNLDVLVRGSHDTNLDGYAAGRVLMNGGVATFNIAEWSTTRPMVPVTLDGVAPTLKWTQYADTLPFVDEPLDANAGLYTRADDRHDDGDCDAASGEWLADHDAIDAEHPSDDRIC